MRKNIQRFLRTISLVLVLMSTASPAFAQDISPDAPTAIVLQTVDTQPGSFEIVFLVQFAIFLVLLTLLLNGNVQKYMSFRWGNKK